jgi:hypothetical protein
MLEATLVVSIVVLLSIGAWIHSFGFSSSLWVEIGLLLLGTGLIGGIPTGLLYHWTLYRALRLRGPLPEKWLLHPTEHHAGLTEEEARRVKRWFYLGAFGFILCLAGGLLAVIGALLGRL